MPPRNQSITVDLPVHDSVTLSVDVRGASGRDTAAAIGRAIHDALEDWQGEARAAVANLAPNANGDIMPARADREWQFTVNRPEDIPTPTLTPGEMAARLRAILDEPRLPPFPWNEILGPGLPPGELNVIYGRPSRTNRISSDLAYFMSRPVSLKPPTPSKPGPSMWDILREE